MKVSSPPSARMAALLAVVASALAFQAAKPGTVASSAEAQAASGSPTARAAARRAPLIRQLVVFRSGNSKARRLRAARTIVRVGRRKRCAVARGTPLAALARSKVARIRLRDYGACSRRRASDSGGLFVRKLGRDANRGQNGWVYKVGHKLATAGAADPSGPFGRGRLRSGKRVTWFYCLADPEGGCQRTLGVRTHVGTGGAVSVRVRGYDNFGRGVLIVGATVRIAGRSAVTDADGWARFVLPPGRYKVRATKPGLVRSFSERVVVPE